MDCICKFYPCSYSGNPKFFQSKSLEKRNEKQSMTLTVSFTVACPWTDPVWSPSLLPLPATPPSPWWAPLLWGPASPTFLLLPVLPATPSIPCHHFYTQERNVCIHDPWASHTILTSPQASTSRTHCIVLTAVLPAALCPLQWAQSQVSVPLVTIFPPQLLLQGPRYSLVPVFMAVTVLLADMFSASPLPRPQASWKQGCAYSPHPHSTPTSLQDSEELLVHHGRQKCRE